jgi:hypothetical protein
MFNKRFNSHARHEFYLTTYTDILNNILKQWLRTCNSASSSVSACDAHGYSFDDSDDTNI